MSSSFFKLAVEEHLKNKCECTKLKFHSTKRTLLPDSLKKVWKGEILLSLLQKKRQSSRNEYLDEDPIPPTLGALHHVKGMCDRATCLYCNQ